MTSPVHTPISVGALEGPATGCAIGWGLIARGFALRVTDMGKLLFSSPCFSSACGKASATRKGILVCLACDRGHF